MTVHGRTSRVCTALLLGSTAALAPVVAGAWVTADAAPNPGQSIWNDYGQSPAEVTTEVTSQVNAAPAVIKARRAVTTAHSTLLARITAEKAAHSTYLKAVKSKNKARIATTKKAWVAAQKRVTAARTAENAAKAALTKVLASTTKAIRAGHYTPVDGTWTGDVAQYFIPDTGLEPIQVQITVYGGHVSDVSVPVYATTGDSGSYNAMALPTLMEEAMAAHESASVAAVTGATLTSGAFAKSLTSALVKAGYRP